MVEDVGDASPPGVRYEGRGGSAQGGRMHAKEGVGRTSELPAWPALRLRDHFTGLRALVRVARVPSGILETSTVDSKAATDTVDTGVRNTGQLATRRGDVTGRARSASRGLGSTCAADALQRI